MPLPISSLCSSTGRANWKCLLFLRTIRSLLLECHVTKDQSTGTLAEPNIFQLNDFHELFPKLIQYMNFFFYVFGHDKCCHLLCSTVRMLNMTQRKDQGLGNFVTCEYILRKEVRPPSSFCLSITLGGSQSFWKGCSSVGQLCKTQAAN